MTIFMRLLTEQNKSASMLQCVDAVRSDVINEHVFDIEPDAFRAVPGAPFAYWVSEAVRGNFSKHPPFESGGRAARVGLQTSDDFRFVRAWWEVDCQGERWWGFAKGGSFSPYFSDVHLVLNWADDGRIMKAWADPLYGNSGWSRILKSTDFYARPGLTWPRRTNGLSFRVMPQGCIFADKGPAAFVLKDDPNSMLALCAIINSKAFGLLVSVQLSRTELAQSFEVGLIQQTPVPNLSSDQQFRLATLAKSAWSLKRKLSSTKENSHAFIAPAAILAKLGVYDPVAIENELALRQAEINAITFELYGFNEDDRYIAETFDIKNLGDAQDGGKVDVGEDVGHLSQVDNNRSLLSWAVGVAFGRFDWRIASNERLAPSEPEPFDLLPEKSPGMLPNGVEPFHHHPGFLVDDPGHPHDISGLVERVLTRVNTSVPEDARHWLQRDFFSFHLSQYSKSRRRAPIYWQIATASGQYSIWLYAPTVNKDTFFRLQQDIIEPKIANEERLLADLSKGGPELDSRVRHEVDNKIKFVEQLKQLADEVRRIAQLWNPSIDDGAVLTAAPLWRLSINHQVWQKELRTRWQELQSGRYDWSHQAMHLWPERVVPKCAEDRSLAIAHDLEQVFWFESEFGKWAKRDVPTRAISEIVRERTSDAVKAALKELLEAPEPTATGSRSRRKA